MRVRRQEYDLNIFYVPYAVLLLLRSAIMIEPDSSISAAVANHMAALNSHIVLGPNCVRSRCCVLNSSSEYPEHTDIG